MLLTNMQVHRLNLLLFFFYIFVFDVDVALENPKLEIIEWLELQILFTPSQLWWGRLGNFV